jgi:hypothetical protein
MKSYFSNFLVCFCIFSYPSLYACEIEKLFHDGTYHVIGVVSEDGNVSSVTLNQVGTLSYVHSHEGRVDGQGNVSKSLGYGDYIHIGRVRGESIARSTLNQTSTELFDYQTVGRISGDGYVAVDESGFYSTVGRGNCSTYLVGGAALLLGLL